MLSEAGKVSLLRIARQTLESVARGEKLPVPSVREPELLEKRGVFVTLKEDGHLRGCIGFPEPQRSLLDATVEATAAAAMRDPRFDPVTEEELADIHIEISVLSAMEPVKDVNLIEPGRHGLLIRMAQGGVVFSGLLLPQVASEYGWDREEFLRQTCLKAGLPGRAWQKGAEIFSFTAEVFGETEEG